MCLHTIFGPGIAYCKRGRESRANASVVQQDTYIPVGNEKQVRNAGPAWMSSFGKGMFCAIHSIQRSNLLLPSEPQLGFLAELSVDETKNVTST